MITCKKKYLVTTTNCSVMAILGCEHRQIDLGATMKVSSVVVEPSPQCGRLACSVWLLVLYHRLLLLSLHCFGTSSHL